MNTDRHKIKQGIPSISGLARQTVAPLPNRGLSRTVLPKVRNPGAMP